MSSTKAEQSSISSSLTRLDRDSWLQTEDALIGILGDKEAKAPLIVTREEYVEGRTLGMKGEGLIEEMVKHGNDYDKDNDQVHNVLSIVFRNCGEASAILHKYRAGRTIEERNMKEEEDEIGDKIQPKMTQRITWTADGRAAWEELKSTALGGLGIESVERDLTELYELSESTSTIQARQMIIKHESLVQKIKNAPDFGLDTLFKVHILKIMKKYGNDFDVVEHTCSTDQKVNYNQTCRQLQARINRLGDNKEDNTGEAFLMKDQCAHCKEYGHWKNDCPHLRNWQGEDGQRRKGNKGGKGGKGNKGKRYGKWNGEMKKKMVRGIGLEQMTPTVSR